MKKVKLGLDRSLRGSILRYCVTILVLLGEIEGVQVIFYTDSMAHTGHKVVEDPRLMQVLSSSTARMLPRPSKNNQLLDGRANLSANFTRSFGDFHIHM